MKNTLVVTRLFLSLLVALMAGGALASAVRVGNTITFDVAEGVTETYDTSIPADVSVVNKKGLGTIKLTQAGGHDWYGLTVNITEGIVQLENVRAFNAYNFINISAGAQFYVHDTGDRHAYAPFYHKFQSVAGNGPDGTGAIRIDATGNMASCFRGYIGLSGDATFRLDVNTGSASTDKAGFGAAAELSLNGHTLTIDGHSKTVFYNDPESYVDTNPRVTPGNGGKIVLNTLANPIIDRAEFKGDASNLLVLNKATSVKVPTAFPWTVVSGNDEPGAESHGWMNIASGTYYMLGSQTVHRQTDSFILGTEGKSGAGAALVVQAGTVLCQSSSSLEIRSQEQGPVPALYKIEAGAVVTNKSASTWGNAGSNYKLATQNWGDFNQSEAYGVANRNGWGFFALEDGRLNLGTTQSQLLGVPGTRGVFQQDGGVLAYAADSYLCYGGRSDYLMRGGSFAVAPGSTFYLTGSERSAADQPDDLVTFSLVGPGNPQADLNGALYLNARTGVKTCLNLNAGRLTARSFCLPTGTKENPSDLNFNGGTLAMPANAWGYLCWEGMTPRVTTVYGKGATFEINRSGLTPLVSGAYDWVARGECSFPVRGAFGKGVKSIRLPAGMPTTGYRGIMPVKVVAAEGDATGEGALAALDFDVAKGEVKSELLILCPGCGYTLPPQVIAYGPDYETAYTCEVELTDEDQKPGPIVKTGVGELMFNSSDNTYAGTYIVSNGLLLVNANATIASGASVLLAGGRFSYDWTDRTIKSLGGYGGFYGCKNDDGANSIAVTDSLDFDVADLNEGRCLEMESDLGDKQQVARDYLSLGDDCVVRLAHPELLPEDDDTKSYTLLKVNVPLNRKPVLENADQIGDGRWKVKLTNGGKTLKLGRSLGFSISIR